MNGDAWREEDLQLGVQEGGADQVEGRVMAVYTTRKQSAPHTG